MYIYITQQKRRKTQLPKDFVSRPLTYASCRSFRCEATMVRYFRTPPRRSVRFRVAIVFRKPRDIKVDWDTEPYEDANNHHCIVAVNGKAFRYESARGEWSREDSIEMALAAEAGISGGLASFIPAFLLGLDDLLAPANSYIQAPDVKLEGQPCFTLLSSTDGGGTRRITVAKHGLAILEVTERFQISSGEVEVRTRYTNIRWNPPLESCDSVFALTLSPP